MKTVCGKDQCAGCTACVDICTKQAIKIKDSLYAYNAVIDESRCIGCNACYSICQVNNSPVLTEPVDWKEGWAKDEYIREKSSSGGIAAELARSFVKNGGIVCSCAFQQGEFEFSFAENEEQIKKFAGSKYVKSNPHGIYKKIAQIVKNGQKVLFIGLPCQVAAAKRYIKNNNLYTVDLICHGTPSPKILEAFLMEHGVSLKEINDINFRVKTRFGLEQNKERFTVPTITDNYLLTFLNSISYTENCYNCQYAKSVRIGDLTIGDSWGSELPKEILKKGVSLILCQNDKGKELLQQSRLNLLDVDFRRAIEFNHQLDHPSVKPVQRELFLKDIIKGRRFSSAVFKAYPKQYLKNVMKTLLYKMTRG